MTKGYPMKDRDPARVVENFVDRYGRDRLRWFVTAIDQGMSGAVIAAELGVSRERVRQWKGAFGTLHRWYEVSAAVAAYTGARCRRPGGDS